MSGLIETHRSFVNSWESDENAHLNVQFYAKRFDASARFFDMLSAGGGHDGPLPRDRHVRYHAELHAGSTTLTRSAAIAGGAFDGCVVHFLENAETGVLCATALDVASGLDHRCRIGEAEAERALPRSAPAAPLVPIAPDDIRAMGGLVTNRSILEAGECGPDGAANEQAHVSRISDAAPHTWNRAGVSVEWLKENGLGRVAVEMKITHHMPAKTGDPLTVHSAPHASGTRTVGLRHEIVRESDGAAIASSEVIALILDLTTRKATALPDEISERLARTARATVKS